MALAVSLRSFLQEAGLGGYEHALKEAGIRTANDILEVEEPLELLDLSCLEEQCVACRQLDLMLLLLLLLLLLRRDARAVACPGISLIRVRTPKCRALIRSLVELRRTVMPPLPLPPGKRYHFYIIHSDPELAELLTRSLERKGATTFTNHVVTYRRAEGSMSRWHVPKRGFSPIGANRAVHALQPASPLHCSRGTNTAWPVQELRSAWGTAAISTATAVAAAAAAAAEQAPRCPCLPR
jgi:hypothetical protein